MDPMASAEKPYGLDSTFGRRDAYGTFVKQQNGLGDNGCAVTMYSLYTSFCVKQRNEKAI
jgi:hypothetical protein